MRLDSHGKLAVVEVIVYIPIGLFCIYNNIRHGFRRDVGWIYLTIFSIVKIAGSVMTIQVENGKNTSMATTATILNTVALSPLLNASLCFLNVGLDKARSFARHIAMALKFLHVLIIIGLVLSITGGINRTKTAQDSLDDGARELQSASIVFALVWILMAIACLVYIANLRYVQNTAKRLVLSVTIALPFLLVRIVYSALNAINLDTSSSLGHTTKFNPVLGSWGLYLALGLATEFAVVVLYTLSGIVNSFAETSDTAFGYQGVAATRHVFR
ncbi:hypothetical protein M441DRAFT_447112 [Trichoderma asperellum CBS 433.97]|uniref:DUF7702 domain-containing protein n=1 Tax=Trichoderma asperellum (strain ATCC 204424 / CBS 433.97 / NBRC 101777) TaxID=1042311 RepID=A0A2T3Z0J5_TRIA4|nr:hypothetical protein M441DRAFT_447112 [Trichoderma asperellum CBS 433.97]PTB38294.1 hypothetical protein M441DRAFT_447112 [Trichoderma asperellum CBS 433.97]